MPDDFFKNPHLPDKPQELAPFLNNIIIIKFNRLPGFTEPVFSATLDKVMKVLYTIQIILSIEIEKNFLNILYFRKMIFVKI